MLLHAAALHQAVATPSWPCTCTKHVPHQHWCRCTAPVPQAVEQYEAIREKEREQLEELEAARRESKAATEAFQAVQQRRYDAFTSAFEHVAAHIDPIYKVGLVAARVVCACVLPVLCMCSTRLRGYVCVCVCVCVCSAACLPATADVFSPAAPAAWAPSAGADALLRAPGGRPGLPQPGLQRRALPARHQVHSHVSECV